MINIYKESIVSFTEILYVTFFFGKRVRE